MANQFFAEAIDHFLSTMDASTGFNTQQQNKQEMDYKIFNLKELSQKLGLSSSRKGTKTEDYLENIIKEINKSGKYQWIQFFQLVDVFYVVVEASNKPLSRPLNTGNEIDQHYSGYRNIEPETQSKSQRKSEPEPEVSEKENIYSGKKVTPSKFPWKQNQ